MYDASRAHIPPFATLQTTVQGSACCFSPFQTMISCRAQEHTEKERDHETDIWRAVFLFAVVGSTDDCQDDYRHGR